MSVDCGSLAIVCRDLLMSCPLPGDTIRHRHSVSQIQPAANQTKMQKKETFKEFSNSSDEKAVSGEDGRTRAFEVKSEVALGMARCLQSLERQTAYGDLIAASNETSGTGNWFHCTANDLEIWILLFELRVASRVIPVLVSAQDMTEIDSVYTEPALLIL